MDIEQYRTSDPDGIEFRQGTSLVDAHLSGGKAPTWDALESTFDRCDFSGSRAEFCFGAGKRMSVYTDCRFDGSRIGARVPGRARLVRCSFQRVTMNHVLFDNAEFIDCVSYVA